MFGITVFVVARKISSACFDTSGVEPGNNL